MPTVFFSRSKPRRPRRAPTGRAIVLGAVVVLLLVVLASPLSRWFASRAALGQAAQQLQRHEQQLAQVRERLKNWQDPGYVQRQARTVLQYAMPGDKTYIVVRRGAATTQRAAGRPGTAKAAVSPSWNARLWHSVQQADARQ